MIFDVDLSTRIAIGYARESAADRKEKRGQTTKSVKQQTDLITGWAERVKVRLREVLSDKVSASDYSTKSREQWEDVVRLLETGACNMLACWEPSRLSRDQMVWARLMQVCRERHALIVLDGKVYDPTDGDDEFMLNLLFLLGQKEVRQLSKRISRDKAAAAEAGLPNGGIIAAGLHHKYEHTPGRPPRLVGVEPNWDLVPLVSRVFDLFVQDCLTKSKIAAILQAEGVPTLHGGRIWRSTTIDAILRNKAYIGVRVHHGKVVNDQAWPAIVDPEIFWAAQRILSEKKGEPFSRTRTRIYKLSSLPRCGICGESCRGAPPRERQKTPARYRCVSGGCVSVPLADLEEFVDGFIEELLSREDWWRELVKVDDATLVAVRIEAEKARAELAELETLVERGDMSLRLAAAAEKGIQARLDDAERRLTSPSLPLPVRQILGPRAAETYRALNPDAQREIIRACARITIKPGGIGGRYSKPIQERVEIKPAVG